MSTAPPFARWLAECRERLGDPPRKFSWWARFSYLSVVRPDWAAADPLRPLIDDLSRVILKTGRVVWGHLVQANGMLFAAGKHDAPAEAVCATGGDDPDLPFRLGDIASRLFRLKGTTGHPPEAQAIADHLAAETTRAFGLPVPADLSGGEAAEMCTIFVCRHHLPEGRLTCPLFPLAVTPDRPRHAAVVPSRYWPEGLIQFWRESGR